MIFGCRYWGIRAQSEEAGRIKSGSRTFTESHKSIVRASPFLVHILVGARVRNDQGERDHNADDCLNSEIWKAVCPDGELSTRLGGSKKHVRRRQECLDITVSSALVNSERESIECANL